MQQAISTLFLSGIFIVLLGLWLYKKEHQMLAEIEKRLDDKEQNLLDIYEGVEEIIKEIKLVYNNSNRDTAGPGEHVEVDLSEDEHEGAEDGSYDKRNEAIHEKINGMLDQGTHTDQEIASELKIGLGEVMLIKSLSKRRHQS